MNVSLTPELEGFILLKVESGRYRSSSEVVREALRLLQERDGLYQARLREIQADLELGADDLATGNSEVFDTETAELLKKEVRRRASDRGPKQA